MKVRLPLYAQIFGMLFLYLLTLTAIVFISLNAKFGFGWEALIKSPVGDRVNTIADAVVGRLASSKKAEWDEILKSYEKRHHLQFYLFDVFGHQLAGAKVEVPKTFAPHVLEFAGHHRFGPGPHAMVRMRVRENGDQYFEGHSFEPTLPPTDRMPQATNDRLEPPPGGEIWPRPGGEMWPPPGGPPPEFAKPGPQIIHGVHDPMIPPDFGPSGGGPPSIVRVPPELMHVPPELMHARGQFLLRSQNPDRFWICTHVIVSALDIPLPMPCVLIAETDNIWQNNLLFDTTFLLEAAAAVLILSLIFWWPFVYSISHSLSKLTTATEAIAEGRFDTQLEVKRGDEIGRLSEAVNIMAGRLASFVSGQKRFLGDISHELFSPLARLQMALELLDEDATENQKAMVNDIREEVSEMNNLVNELLAFSKAGLKGREIELTVVNIKAIVSEQLDRMNLRENVVFNFFGEPRAVADTVLLSRAISNVLRNAVRYAGDKGPITITADRHSDQVTITISDCGTGVPEEALSRLAEPFFRPEASRSRSSGGVGLGLAIVKSCIEACNGTVVFRNRAQGGFEVEMRLQQA
ncbi:MAG TPA: HAMP domain-containing sensor histidine kinase [Oculatellaceae cyanobacterium]